MERSRGVVRHLVAAVVLVTALVSGIAGAPSALGATTPGEHEATPTEPLAPVAAEVRSEVAAGPVDVIVVTTAPGEQVAEAVLSEVPEGSVDGVVAGSAPQVAATVDADGLEALRRAPYVERIVENRKNFATADTWAENIGLPGAHDAGWDGSGQTIAVLDSGVQANHPYLTGKVVAEGCFSSGGSFGTASLCPGGGHTGFGPGAAAPCTLAILECQHGTHVAGIVAGGPTPSAGRTLTGVAPGASIVAVQIFTKGTTTQACEGQAPCVFAFDSDLNAALHWIDTQVQAGASGFQNLAAVNLSLGGGPSPGTCDDSPTKPYVDALAARGVITVAATGNAGLNSGAFPGASSPACISSVVSVGATTLDGTLADYSNLTAATTVLAPGGPIVSSTPGSTYGALTGTSMSAPVVSGAIALLREKGLPSKSDIVSRLTSTGDPVATAFGTRAEVALDSALLGVPNSPRAATATAGDGYVDLAWTAPSYLGDGSFTGYTVTSQPASAGCTTAGATACRVSGLQNGTAYTFAVQAVGSAGPGGRAVVTGRPRTVPGAPPHVVAVAGHRSLTVSWVAPATGGATIQGYRATAQPVGASCTTNGATSCTIGGLTNGVAYTVTVTATNEAGTGPSSAPSAAATPVWAPNLPAGPPIGVIDTAVGGLRSVTVSGWTIDPTREGPIAVHVYVDGVGVATTADQLRPDVGVAFDRYGPLHGYTATVPATPGPHTVCAWGIGAGGRGNTLLGCRSVTVPTGPPFGVIDRVSGLPGAVSVQGWAIDPDTGDPIAVHVYVDGMGVAATADQLRPDVGAAFAGYGDRHGYTAVAPASAGPHTACAWAIGVGAGGNTLLGCRTVTVPSGPPFGVIDLLARSGSNVTVAGWAIDPDTAAAIDVRLVVGGSTKVVRADGSRPDVGVAFPGYGDRHGFATTLTSVPPGVAVCVVALNVGAGAESTLGCRTV